MKKILLFIALFTLTFYAFAQTTAKNEIEQQITAWHEGLQKADLPALMAQYASDAVFFPTFINATRTADERKVFLQALINRDRIDTWTVTGFREGDAAFADYLISATYAYRF